MVKASEALAQVSSDLSWLLTYDSKSTNELVHDKRFVPFLRKYFGNARMAFWGNETVLKGAVEFLGGPPDNVHVLDGRYVTASACVAHFCQDSGLLWVDAAASPPVVAFVAHVLDSHAGNASPAFRLWLVSKTTLTPANIPAPLKQSISMWLDGALSTSVPPYRLQKVARATIVNARSGRKRDVPVQAVAASASP